MAGTGQKMDAGLGSRFPVDVLKEETTMLTVPELGWPGSSRADAGDRPSPATLSHFLWCLRVWVHQSQPEIQAAFPPPDTDGG